MSGLDGGMGTWLSPPEPPAVANEDALADLFDFDMADAMAPRFDHARLGFVIDDEGKAVWAANKILQAREDEGRIKLASKEAIADRKARRERTEARFMRPLRDYTEANLPHGKKSIVTLAGTLALRSHDERLLVHEPEEALAWCVDNLPGVVITVPSIATGILTLEAIAVLREHAPHLIVETPTLRMGADRAIINNFKETGELPTGCEWQAAGNEFSLRPPKGGKE